MKKQGNVIVGFILVLVIVIFSVMNTESVAVSFGFAKMNAPLVLVILGSAIIGALIVLLTASTTLWKRGREIKDLKKSADAVKKNCETQIQDLESAEAEKIETAKKDVKETFEKELMEKQKQINELRQKLFQHLDD